MATLLGKPFNPPRQPAKPVPPTISSVGSSQRMKSSPNRTGIRPAGFTVRPQSPTIVNGTTTISSSKRPLSPEAQRRPKTSHSRSNSLSGITEGIGNLNRWSQSTVSSKASGNTHQRRNSFARRLSGSFGSLAPFNNQQLSPSKVYLKKPSSSPGNSPQRLPPNPPVVPAPTRFSPGVTLSSLSYAVETTDTPLSGLSFTPATADLLSSASGDYFGDKRANTSPPRQQTGGDRKQRLSVSTSSPSRNRQSENGRTFLSYTEPNQAGPSIQRRDSRNTEYRQRDPSYRSNHSRNRDDDLKGSGSTEARSSTSSARSQGEKRRRRKEPSQKIMLSKALEKANHAVLLDHAQNFEGAVAAYADACNLLQQVMKRNSGDEDRRKLEAIRNTYKNRVAELKSSELVQNHAADKALPDVPIRSSTGTRSLEPFSPVTESEDEDVAVGQIAAARQVYDQPQVEFGDQRQQLPRQNIPPRRQSLLPFSSNDDGGLTPRINMAEHMEPLDSWSIDSPQESILETRMNLAAPMDREYMPPPLSPKRSFSPAVGPSEYFEAQLAVSRIYDPARSQHARQETMESTSWLDTIDESGASSPSSVHSRSSFMGLRRKHIRTTSGDTGAEFDAAFDAAIEEAYDDGFEPAVENPVAPKQAIVTTFGVTGHASNVRRNNDIAKEKAWIAERDTLIAAAHEQEKSRQVKKLSPLDRSESIDMEYGDDDDDDEEERILEEMTRGYILDDTEYDLQSKSALPRQSDSSGFSGRTWGSSTGSNPTTAGTTLSSVAEHSLPPILPIQVQSRMALPPTRPPPSGALPPPPLALTATKATPPLPSAALRPPSLVIITTPGVRERRLSGQKMKQLKIDTTATLPPGMEAPRTQPMSTIPSVLSVPTITDHPKSASLVPDLYQQESDSMLKPSLLTNGVRQVSSPFPGSRQIDSQSGISPATPASAQTVLNGTEGQIPPSPARMLSRAETGAGKIRKNYSSSSLRSIKQSGPTLDDSPSTPLSRVFSSTSQLRSGQLPAVPSLPTPISATFMASALTAGGGMNYFDTDVHSSYEPGAPNPTAPNPPLALEACPESFLLRPFWLMRSMYHAIAHPRGGYLSTRLFVPREIWRVKNVKLKNVDDKVASCDLLTAALHKLSKVDTLDADAVLEEMQSFELVLDQVQAALSKKLGGGEVGLQGSGALFRASSTIDEAETLGPKSTNASSKSYLSGWRKLRSKNSSGPGIQPPIGNMTGRDGLRETLTMRSLPMTSSMNRRFPRRDVKQVQGIGPHGHYMVAIARLCDAVQVLDQIARQAEDPGLKHSSQTHVGLELSMRHAAEFFGFYICRFVLADVGMMLDKFIKRGTEWAST